MPVNSMRIEDRGSTGSCGGFPKTSPASAGTNVPIVRIAKGTDRRWLTLSIA